MSNGFGPLGEVAADIDFVTESYRNDGTIVVRERWSSSDSALELIVQTDGRRVNVMLTNKQADGLAELIVEYLNGTDAQLGGDDPTARHLAAVD